MKYECKLLDCPTCGTRPETRQWRTYCPKCGLEAPFGETPDECEMNWNKMNKPPIDLYFSRDRYLEICKRAETLGFEVKTKWQKNLKTIKLGDVVIATREGTK